MMKGIKEKHIFFPFFFFSTLYRTILLCDFINFCQPKKYTLVRFTIKFFFFLSIFFTIDFLESNRTSVNTLMVQNRTRENKCSVDEMS